MEDITFAPPELDDDLNDETFGGTLDDDGDVGDLAGGNDSFFGAAGEERFFSSLSPFTASLTHARSDGPHRGAGGRP